ATASNDPDRRTTAVYRDFQFMSLAAAPVIGEQPKAQTVEPGADVVLRVSANGPGPFQFQWRLNGQNIPGATGDTLVLGQVTPQNAGIYTVVVLNGVGIETSQTAEIVVITPALPFQDAFDKAQLLASPGGTGSGSNVRATVEPGEPLHAGKSGGKSVWLAWQAEESGVATFTTEGSAIDTLLAVYEGSRVGALAEVAASDDETSFYSSAIRFNAVRGTIYHIAVDGFAGAEGRIVLNWSLRAAKELVPVILEQPLSQSVRLGEPVTLGVKTLNADTFQWFFNGAPIARAADDRLTISSVLPETVGIYSVQVANSLGEPLSAFRVNSLPAAVEIGPFPGAVSLNKFQDLPVAEGFDALAPGPGAASFLSSGSAPILVGAGTTGTQILNNQG
ncbi:MAG TPA: immunoglobulin domain-containing protein, partial [Verrucomicrobiae bacterium]|nr:immunoglobulin domain-containing protein [Verrucomicrobiae bacterium]